MQRSFRCLRGVGKMSRIVERYARALAAVRDWCRKNRHRPIREQHAQLATKMRGHYAYYGVTGNVRRLSWYFHQVRRIWRKSLSRRGSRLNWTQFAALLTRHPLPAAQIVHRYTAVSEALPCRTGSEKSAHPGPRGVGVATSLPTRPKTHAAIAQVRRLRCSNPMQ